MSSARRQRVEIVGFLRSQLSGLHGIPTLCYELIQNADDVKDEQGKPAASRITFDVHDDALWVENDGVFRERDFERMERISWGDKRNEAGTTGTFGIGFISVYQITDAPEIFSSGRHWTLHPEHEENIIEETVETELTRFRLPWAFEASTLRQELGIPPVKPHQLDDFVEQIRQAIDAASLFLKQVTVLELKRAGNVVQHIQIEREGSQLLVQANDVLTTWLILERSFDDREIRCRYGDLIEEKRSATVKLAIPDTPLDNGLLYAFLPSETRTGLPFHINADFYPSPDRKRILLDSGYKCEWNRLAIRRAAQTLADHVEALLSQFAPVTFWEFVERVRRAAEQHNKEYAGFLETLNPGIRNKATCMTLSNQRCRPAEAFYLDTDEQAAAGAIFQSLGLPIVHSALRSYQNLLLENGCRRLKVPDVHQAFDKLQLCQRTEQAALPACLQTREHWQTLWRALQNLLQRTPQSEQSNARILLGKCAIAFGTDDAAWPPNQLLRAEAETQALFSSIQPRVWYAPEKQPHEFVTSLVPSLSLHKGVDILEKSQSALRDAWKAGRFAFSHLYGWLANQRNELVRDAALRNRLPTCPIWPAADGALQPLTKLYLPGDFADPLGLAQLVDVKELGGHELLENSLGVRRLDFLTYVRDFMPPIVCAQGLSTSRRLELLKMLAENLGKLQGQGDLKEKLSALPLVWCGANRFSGGSKVYFDTAEIRQLLGEKYTLAQIPEAAQYEAIKALYEWLGVQASPRIEHLVREIEAEIAHTPDADSISKIETIFEYLATNWSVWKKEGIPPQFEKLKKTAWLRASKDATRWFLPKDVNSVFRSYLFESQGNFLQIDRRLQERGSDFLAYLGVNSEPTPMQMVRHLLWCSDRNQPVSQEVYRRLNERLEEIEPAVLRTLIDSRSLYLKYPNGEAHYVKPSLVFWEDHPFGSYRFKLGLEFSAFKPLLDRLDVKTKPDASDAINVLLEIADQYGSANAPIDQSSAVWSTIIECWRMLSQALERGEITEDETRHHLGEKKTIPAGRNSTDGTTVFLLEPPMRLFFDDRPRWGIKFQMLENNLVKQIDGAWQAMLAAGVRRLSEVVDTGLHNCSNPRNDSFITSRVVEREPLIKRVIEAYREKVAGQFDTDALRQLNFIQGDSIEIVRTFNGFGRPESVLDSVHAICVDRTLYFCKPNGRYPWLEIASELSYVLYPSAELNSLALELKEIFSAVSADEAGKTLDILGYPQTPEAFSSKQIESPTVSLAGEASIIGQEDNEQNEIDYDEKPNHDDSSLDSNNSAGNTAQLSVNTTSARPHESNGTPYQTQPHLFNNSDGQGNSAKPDLAIRPPEQRPNTRLYSYVRISDAHKGDSPSEKGSTDHRSEVEKKGIDYVLEYERRQGRMPTDMNTIQSNHPGYDIKSIDAFGDMRYIEVKTLSGEWNGPNPARMTHTEFEHGIKHGEDYWLYIIEHVGTPQERLYIIRNPSQRVDLFLFDHGWMTVAENVTLPSTQT
jgi:hypothetical protein